MLRAGAGLALALLVLTTASARRRGPRAAGLRALVDLRSRAKQRTTVRIVGATRAGRRVTALRRYRLCVPRRHAR